jgi:hypothetical protein
VGRSGEFPMILYLEKTYSSIDKIIYLHKCTVCSYNLSFVYIPKVCGLGTILVVILVHDYIYIKKREYIRSLRGDYH